MSSFERKTNDTMNNKKKKKNDNNTNTNSTSILSVTHGRERRLQRRIHKIDLQRAKLYGMKEYTKNGHVKYTYGGICFIYNPHYKEEVTSWRQSKFMSSTTSGTSICKPILLERKILYDTEQAILKHHLLRTKITKLKSLWKSHTIFVIDMSGSMRRDDINGAKCRSDGVWMILARDFIQTQLQLKEKQDQEEELQQRQSLKKKSTKTYYDVISVVLMQKEATIYMQYEPLTWVLYNKFIELREWDTYKPSGEGWYGPALDAATKLLASTDDDDGGVRCSSSSCALSLLWISDGKPSDPISHQDIWMKKVKHLATKYRRRLTFSCIGMASPEKKNGTNNTKTWSVLERMVQVAKQHGSIATFHVPTQLDVPSMSQLVTTFCTSMTNTKSELTDFKSGKLKYLKPNVTTEVICEEEEKENDGTSPFTDNNNQWRIYNNTNTKQYVRRIWIWNMKRNDFQYLIDRRCIGCYEEVVVGFSIGCQRKSGYICDVCEVCHICFECKESKQSQVVAHRKGPECFRLLRDKQLGRIHIDDDNRRLIPSSAGVAMKIPIFAEGAERMVHKFRFLDSQNKFIGQSMVAKESRFVHHDNNNNDDTTIVYNERMEYHHEFMRTQSIASYFSQKFNVALNHLSQHFDECYHSWLLSFPRLEFLHPMVVEVMDHNKEINYLIEPMLYPHLKYTKWNNNAGYVMKKKKKQQELEQQKQKNDHHCYKYEMEEEQDEHRNNLGGGLEAIMEEEEEEEVEDEDKRTAATNDDDDNFFFASNKSTNREPEPSLYKDVDDVYFPQAFSHFTYEESGQKLIVVDLQGVFEEEEMNANGDGDGSEEVFDDKKEKATSTKKKLFRFTDPVIHTAKRQRRRSCRKKWSFGRTDRGSKGIQDFFSTHECTDVCKLLGLKER